MKKLKIHNLPEFITFLESLEKIGETAIIDIKKDRVISLTATPDNTILLYGEYALESDFEATINVPDIKKFIRVLDTIPQTEIELTINSNNIEYKSKQLKFKYHLFDENLLTRPPMKIEKIVGLTGDISFPLTKDNTQQIVKGSTFAQNTNKIYFYSDGDGLVAELTDKAKRNTDSFTTRICDIDFELEPIPINFESFRLITMLNQVKVEVNTQHFVFLIDSKSDNIKLRYVATSLVE